MSTAKQKTTNLAVDGFLLCAPEKIRTSDIRFRRPQFEQPNSANPCFSCASEATQRNPIRPIATHRNDENATFCPDGFSDAKAAFSAGFGAVVGFRTTRCSVQLVPLLSDDRRVVEWVPVTETDIELDLAPHPYVAGGGRLHGRGVERLRRKEHAFACRFGGTP